MNHRKLLIVILFVSVLARVTAAVYFGNQVEDLPGTNDQLSYHALALRVANGDGFSFDRPWWPVTRAGEPTAHWSFLYTFFLAGIYKFFGPNPLIARLIQAVMVGLLHPWLAYLLGRKAFNPIVGLAAAGLTAIYAYFVYYSATLMTEPFYITAILASLYLALLIVDDREPADRAHFPNKMITRAIGLGIILSAAVLLRQLFLLVVPFIFLWILWRGGRDRLIPLVISGLLIVVTIVPFTIYNYVRFHRLVLLNTNAGYAFYWGNHPIYEDKFIPILPSQVYQELIPRELMHLDEAALDQALLGRGLQFISNDPVRYLKLSISRIPAYFMFWPSEESSLISNISRVFSFGVFWPFMLVGMLIALVKPPNPLTGVLKSPVSLFLVFVLIYTLIHVLTWTLIRYRLPVDAILLLFAAQAFQRLYQRFILRKNNFHTLSAGTPGKASS